MKSILNPITGAQELDEQTLSSVQGGVLLGPADLLERMRERAREEARKVIEGHGLRPPPPPSPPLFPVRP